MYRTIIITALCGGILVGSVIGGSYIIATAIRQSGDRQVEAIQQAADQQSLATEQAPELAHQQAVDEQRRADERAAEFGYNSYARYKALTK
jgi:hypothetical protein